MSHPAPTDRERFEKLYRANYAAVIRYAARRSGSAAAEEVAAETDREALRLVRLGRPDACRRRPRRGHDPRRLRDARLARPPPPGGRARGARPGARRHPRPRPRSRRDFVSDFRSRYEHGVLDDTGDTTFMGHPARRYVVDHPGVHVPDRKELVGASTGEYFVDPSSGAPLGSISVRFIQVVDRIERLPATPANLEKVRER